MRRGNVKRWHRPELRHNGQTYSNAGGRFLAISRGALIIPRYWSGATVGEIKLWAELMKTTHETKPVETRHKSVKTNAVEAERRDTEKEREEIPGSPTL